MMLSYRAGYALAVVAAAALLAGCGDHAGSGTAPLTDVPNAASGHRTFRYIEAKQSFTVPRNVTQVKVIALGGNGAGYGGDAARVSAVLPVTPGEKLTVYVGGDGVSYHGGFDGGGDGGKGFPDLDGYGGGGASDAREGGDKIADRILVAAGGGGQGGFNAQGGTSGYGAGGKGGMTGGVGATGYGDYYSSYSSGCANESARPNYRVGYGGCGGSGGTQSQGGTGGVGGEGFFCYGDAGANGSSAKGGAGAAASPGSYSSGSYSCGGYGGGGGGGYYGGGGGGEGSNYGSSPIGGGGGGGGGSSYVEPGATNVHYWAGWKAPHNGGLVVFDW